MVDRIKYCNICDTDKKESEFYANRSDCIECRKKYQSTKNPFRNELARRKYPTPHDKCVYAFKEGDEIVYIGESKETSWRINLHYYTNQNNSCFYSNGIKDRWMRERDYTWHILWYGDSYKDRLHQEKLNIQLHQPKFNKILYKNYEG